MKLIHVNIGLLLLLHLLINCGGNSPISGAGGQTTNGVTVAIVYPDGKPGGKIPVRVRPMEYLSNVNKDPETSGKSIVNGTTDNSGIFRVDSLDSGSYMIEVNNSNGLALALKFNTPDSGGVFDAGVEMLEPTGFVQGCIPPDELFAKSWYVQIYGLERIASVNSQNGVFTFSDLPSGHYTFRRFSPDSAVPSIDIENISVKSNDTFVVSSFPAWRYNTALTLNTTSTGANITKNVYGFPVLIRLNAANFDFTQAHSDGKDIRFTKNNGTPVFYEIERWDATDKKAEIWVMVDTIFGNNNTQSITMYWGNPEAESQSNSAAVFDTTTGFTGVWHLGETGNIRFKDATFNHYDGMPSDTAPQAGEGINGLCRSFDGLSNFIRMNGTADSKLNFKENDTYSISAWVNADTLDYLSHLIAGKGNEQYFLKFKSSVQSDPMVWEFVEYHDKTGWQITNSLPSVPSVKTWVLLTGVRKGATQYIYVNGELLDSSITTSPSTVSRFTTDDLSIGKFLSVPVDSMDGRCPFKGKIDEVRISAKACSPDWIKLCYVNQKEQDELVKW